MTCLCPAGRRTGNEGTEAIEDSGHTPTIPRLEGVVIRGGGGRCFVVAEGRLWNCQFRGKLKHGKRTTQSIAVAGDRVMIHALHPELDPPEGVVEEVLPRRNRISRLAARRSGGRREQVLVANLDQIVVVQSLTAPDPQKGFVDRLLMAAERFQVSGILVLNKIDLVPEAAREDPWGYYRTLGYLVLHTSAATGAGIEELVQSLSGRTSILMGASGVGKTSLLNLIDPDLALQVAAVGNKTGLGRHTTTTTELFPLPQGGFIADSPGLRGFDPWDVDPGQVGDYFPEFAQGAAECRFRTCMHIHEPGCEVKKMVATGVIPSWRYEAYLALVRDLEQRRRENQPWS